MKRGEIPDIRNKVEALHSQGLDDTKIAEMLGTTRPSIRYHRLKLGLPAIQRDYTKKGNYIADGIKLVNDAELQSFVRKIKVYDKQAIFTIPKGMLKALGLKSDDYVLIALKKATPLEAKEYILES